MDRMKPWPLWPSWLALLALTGLSVWVLVDYSELPGLSWTGRVCLAVFMVGGGVWLVVGDRRDRKAQERRNAPPQP